MPNPLHTYTQRTQLGFINDDLIALYNAINSNTAAIAALPTTAYVDSMTSRSVFVGAHSMHPIGDASKVTIAVTNAQLVAIKFPDTAIVRVPGISMYLPMPSLLQDGGIQTTIYFFGRGITTDGKVARFRNLYSRHTVGSTVLVEASITEDYAFASGVDNQDNLQAHTFANITFSGNIGGNVTIDRVTTHANDTYNTGDIYLLGVKFTKP